MNAVRDPMLIRERAQLKRQDRAMAFTGMCRFGSTLLMKRENGRPLSRAKANVWREVEALKRMLLKMTGRRIIEVSPFTPAIEVAFLKA